MEPGERDLAAFAETAHELVDVLDEAPDPEGDASSLEVDALRVANKKPVLGSVGLPAFAIGEFMSTVAGGSRKMHERREEEQRAEERKWKEHREERQRKTAMFVTPALPLLAMASSFDSSYWEKELKADLRHDRPFPKYVASRSRMKDLDGEFINLAKYCLWLKFILRGEMEVLERPRIQFYGDLHKEAESDYYEFELFRPDQDGGTTGLIRELELGRMRKYSPNMATYRAAIQMQRGSKRTIQKK